MYPEEGEVIVCNYCGKEQVATEEMEYWFCVSEVKAGEESNWDYYCSYECFRAHATEPFELSVSRERQQREDEKWEEEERERSDFL